MSSILEAEESQLSQAHLTQQMLKPLNHLYGPSGLATISLYFCRTGKPSTAPSTADAAQ